MKWNKLNHIHYFDYTKIMDFISVEINACVGIL